MIERSIMEEQDIYWLAGLIDADGHPGAHKRQGYLYANLIIQMKDEDTVRRCHAITGCGTVGPARSSTGTPMWRWAVQNSRECARLLLAIYPLMSVRRQQQIAECAEALANRKQKIPRRLTREGPRYVL